MERTLVLIKPDAVQRNLVGNIIARLEAKGLQLCGIKMMMLTDELLQSHYRHLLDKPFYPEIQAFMQLSPVVVTCWAGLDAVSTVRQMCGVTKAREATPGTIRGDYAMSIQANVVHASDSVDAAKEELDRFFSPSELLEYDDNNRNYVYSAGERT